MDKKMAIPARVVIIGGGFCGAFCAAQLADKARAPLEIFVIEPRDSLGRGVAYSSTDPAHRINVPAARMTLFPEDPTHFDKWLRAGPYLQDDPAALWHDGHAYPRRAVFGAYVSDHVARRANARADVSIRHIRDDAIAARRDGTGWHIALAGGGEIGADIAVIATSHPPPSPPALLVERLAGDPALIANPWEPAALSRILPSDDVLIVGTGLTMADVVGSLARRGHHGYIVAMSRRGQLSREHAFAAESFAWVTATPPPLSALALSRAVRHAIKTAAARGLPWQVAMDDARANGKILWSALNLTERRRFLRHLRSFWDTHRYRVAPQLAAEIAHRRSAGTLRVLAASLRDVRKAGAKIEVTVHPRGKQSGQTERLIVDRIIVTTGPAHGDVVANIAVLRSLADQGFVQADRLGLGIAVDEIGRPIGSDGVVRSDLFVAGPLARERYGELMGLPQVAVQPDSIASDIANELVFLRKAEAGRDSDL
jgi:uncharacterized NAD(P)/FAD-binding protein YdhS